MLEMQHRTNLTVIELRWWASRSGSCFSGRREALCSIHPIGICCNGLAMDKSIEGNGALEDEGVVAPILIYSRPSKVCGNRAAALELAEWRELCCWLLILQLQLRWPLL